MSELESDPCDDERIIELVSGLLQDPLIKDRVEEVMMEISEAWEEHPYGWEFPCYCYTCRLSA